MIDRIIGILRANVHEIRSHLSSTEAAQNGANPDLFTEANAKPPPAHEEEEAKAAANLANTRERERECYANLELALGASFADVKKAYRRLIKQYHPDRFHKQPDKQLLAIEVSSKLNAAYRYLANKENLSKEKR